MMGRCGLRAEWRVPSVLRSKTLMPGGFTPPAQIKWNGVPAGLAPWGDYGGPAKEAVEQQIAAIEDFVEARC